MNKYYIFVLVLLIILPLSSAAEDDITLLSVMEFENGTQLGGTATFHLETRPGSGKVFLESYPAAKVDLQVATRLANEYACEYSRAHCDQYDFFYTIRSQSPLIGGSSGGAAATVLTLAVLENNPIREDLAMTGAITSGGILTPVAGVKEKIQAAQEENYAVVIIPELVVRNKSNKTNGTVITTDLLDDFSISVHPHLTIQQAYATATNTELAQANGVVEVPKYYEETMGSTAKRLCARMSSLFGQVNKTNTTQYRSAQEFYNKSLKYADTPYASASYCFSANLQLQELHLQKYSNALLAENSQRLLRSIADYEQQVSKVPLVSFTDIETYGIVLERLLEAQTILSELNYTNISHSQLGYAIERYESAQAWSSFFGVDTQKVDFKPSDVREACYSELRSVETRKSYLDSILPSSYLATVEDELAKAYGYSQDGDYALCLFKATKAKAHANMFFTTLTLDQDQLPLVAKAKQEAAYGVIETQKPIFPMLGYSYVDYAKTFNQSEYSALLFAEYGLVFSDVSGYFPPAANPVLNSLFTQRKDFVYFISGLLLGILLTILIARLVRKNPEKTPLPKQKSLPGKKR